jgi:hypothetical protein
MGQLGSTRTQPCRASNPALLFFFLRLTADTLSLFTEGAEEASFSRNSRSSSNALLATFIEAVATSADSLAKSLASALRAAPPRPRTGMMLQLADS